MPSNERSEAILKPANRECTIWRYMDLTKYLHLLSTSSLFFCRGDKIGDKFEGSMPVNDALNKRKGLAELTVEPKIPEDFKKKMLEDNIKLSMNMQKDTFINCWHMSENESMSMWERYGGKEKSIAIKSTYQKLHENLPDSVTTGLVEYIDYEKQSIFKNKKYGASPYFFKRIEFIDEKEVRCIVQRVRMGVQNPEQEYYPNEIGSLIDIDLNVFVDEIVLSPDSKDWFIDLINDVTAKMGYRFNTRGSVLMKAPMF